MSTMLERMEQRLKSHSEMMERCGVDFERLAHDRFGMTLRAAVTACLACREGDVCRAWLDATAGEPVGEPPRFCVNGWRFRAFRRDQ
jgi:hypothetical protein